MLKKRQAGIQGLRGVAALCVCFQHTVYYFCENKGLIYSDFLKFDFGFFGVCVFFVISGYIMSGCLSQGNYFMLNRILRVYPGFWLAILFSFMFSDNRYEVLASLCWKNLLLLPSTLLNIYGIPYWTLVYEMVFYFIIFLFISFKMKHEYIVYFLISWFGIIVFSQNYMVIDHFQPGWFIFFAQPNIYFIFGMLMGLHFDWVSKINTISLSLISIILWGVGSSLRGTAFPPIICNLILPLACCGIVLLSMRHLKMMVLQKMGDFSYGIYLVHVPLALFILKNIEIYIHIKNLFIMWIFVMFFTLFGALTFGWLENNLYLQLKKYIRKSSKNGSTVLIKNPINL